MRQIILDTETTGLDPQSGHRIIEIGCVELVNRKLTERRFHQYLNPDREIDEGATEVHGIRNEDLVDKPKFAEIADDFLQFINGAELIIHNAPFDVGFINMELRRCSMSDVEQFCTVVDTLAMARSKHPGQKNNLDALCKRYSVDNSQRIQHGALLDAEILADVYLAMTGGQASLAFEVAHGEGKQESVYRVPANRSPLPILYANEAELLEHKQYLELLDKKSHGQCVWKKMAEPEKPN